VHAGLLLSIGILNQGDLGICLKARDLGQLNEIVDTRSIKLQVEACVLEGTRQLDNGLANILDLFLARYLKKDHGVR